MTKILESVNLFKHTNRHTVQLWTGHTNVVDCQQKLTRGYSAKHAICASLLQTFWKNLPVFGPFKGYLCGGLHFGLPLISCSATVCVSKASQWSNNIVVTKKLHSAKRSVLWVPQIDVKYDECLLLCRWSIYLHFTPKVSLT